MIVVRWADDFVIGFQSKTEAERCLAETVLTPLFVALLENIFRFIFVKGFREAN